MTEMTKGKSPFYPGQPVPVELFVGRNAEISRILTRGVGQVAMGKPIAMFVQGEYGIGKSSVAGYVQWRAEVESGLHVIYAALGGCRNLSDLSEAVLKATVRSGAFDSKKSEKIRNWLGKYIGNQELFGLNLNLEALKKDAPSLVTPHGLLDFLKEAKNKLGDTGVKGIMLVLDEINGITSDPQFAHYVKALVDTNSAALSKDPLPLLLMLCGVEEKRREMIRSHEPVDRIFDVVDIGVMTAGEMREFFDRAFQSVQMKVENDAMEVLIHNSGGFPKIMHLVGDAAYWIDSDGVIDGDDATGAVVFAAEEVGRKYLDQQVYKALKSKDYHSILKKIGQTDIDMTRMSFSKSQLARGLSESERKKLTNFLHKMKDLKVLRSGDVKGEYIFNVRMHYLYVWLRSMRKASAI